MRWIVVATVRVKHDLTVEQLCKYITNISIVARRTTPTITVELKTKERAMHMAK